MRPFWLLAIVLLLPVGGSVAQAPVTAKPPAVRVPAAKQHHAKLRPEDPPLPIVHPVYPTGGGTPLGAQIAALLADPAVSRAHWGIAVTTMEGTPVYGLDEAKLFRPASNNKIFTTAAAMELLGPNSKISTVAYASVLTSADGTLGGDLSLQGAGDANLSGRTLPYVSAEDRKASDGDADRATVDPFRYIDELAADVAKAGVRHITGDIIGDDTICSGEPYPDTWGHDDLVWGYGAPVSELSVIDNQLRLTVSPGQTAGSVATAALSPDIGYYKLDAVVTTVAAQAPATLLVDRAPGSRTILVRGTVALGAPDISEIAIDDPAAFAAMVFRMKLLEHGIQVDGVARAEHGQFEDAEDFLTEIDRPALIPSRAYMNVITDHMGKSNAPHPVNVQHVSAPLRDDVKVTLKVSQNLHAELMLRHLGAKWTEMGRGSNTEGVRVVRTWLIDKGLDPADFIFYDGSGLSPHNLVTPRAMATFLAAVAPQSWFPAWKSSLPEGGVDGGLDKRFPQPELKHHLFAKTGTLGESRALSGYVDAASGRTLIFSIFVDNHTPGSSADRTVMDKIVAAIAAAN